MAFFTVREISDFLEQPTEALLLPLDVRINRSGAFTYLVTYKLAAIHLRAPRPFPILNLTNCKQGGTMRIPFQRGPRVIVFGGFVTIAAVLTAKGAWAANGTWRATANLGVVQGQNTATLLQD